MRKDIATETLGRTDVDVHALSRSSPEKGEARNKERENQRDKAIRVL